MLLARALADVPDGPGHHHRQRILRRAAGPSGGEDRGRLARALVDIDADGKLAFSIAPDPMPHFDLLLPQARAQRADGVDLRMAHRHRGDRARPPARARRRRRAGDRLRPCRKRRRRHAAGGRQARLRRSAGRARQVDLTAHVDFQALGARRRSHGRDGLRPDRPGAVPAPARHRDPRRHAQGRRPPTPGRRDRRRARAPDRRGRTGMGELFKAAAFAHPTLGVPPGFD